MAKGMNVGILSLLGVVVVVLSGVAAFFVHLARKAKSVHGAEVEPTGRVPPTRNRMEFASLAGSLHTLDGKKRIGGRP